MGITAHYRNPPETRAEASLIMEIKYAWAAANGLGHSRATGASVLGARGQGFIPEDLQRELRQTASEYFRVQRQFREIAGEAGQVFYRASVTDNAIGTRAEVLLQGLASDPHGFNVSKDDWFDTMTAALAGRQEFGNARIEELLAHQQANIRDQAIPLAIELALCVMAAVVIINAQFRLQRRVRVDLELREKFNAASRAFVPTQFLQLANLPSITAVTSGSHTEARVALLFAQLRDFATVSHALDKNALFAWLQRYFAAMSEQVEKCGGFVDKFIGDCIFAAFVAPTPAVRCAVEMQVTAGKLNQDIVARDEEQLVGVGIGIHFATVAIGFLGDENRLTGTMVSSDVNMASRLEGMTKYYGADVIFSQALYDALEAEQHDGGDGTEGGGDGGRASGAYAGDNLAFHARHLGQVAPKGAREPYRIFELFQADALPMKKHKQQTKAKFERAVYLRECGQSEAAASLFHEVAAAAEARGLKDRAVEIKLTHTGGLDAFGVK